MDGDAKRTESLGSGAAASEPTGADGGAVLSGSSRADSGAVLSPSCGAVAVGRDEPGSARVREWAVLGEWLASPPPLLHKVDLEVLQERLAFMGRARACLVAAEADVVAEISRREGDAAAEETLRRTQKRSRRGARKAVKVAAQLEWAPNVAEKLADGAITPEAAGLILDAEGPVDQRELLAAAEEEPEDQFRRTLKDHVNERTSEAELEARREQQRRRRRASIREQGDGMFHLFAQLDPLTGARVQAALIAKSDQMFRSEDPKDRPTAPQRFADALTELITTSNSDSAGAGAPGGVELLVLADYDQTRDAITNARLADGTHLTEAETLALACDAKILPGIFNKHTGTPLLGRAQRKVSPRHRKRLIARDGGCIGCRTHHNICEVHHRNHWAHGGETTLENTCLLCWRCHHIRVHLHGEQVTRHPNGHLTLTPPTNTTTGSGDRDGGGGSSDGGGGSSDGGGGSSDGGGGSSGGDSNGVTRPPPHNHHRPRPHETIAPTRPDTHPAQAPGPCHQPPLPTPAAKPIAGRGRRISEHNTSVV